MNRYQGKNYLVDPKRTDAVTGPPTFCDADLLGRATPTASDPASIVLRGDGHHAGATPFPSGISAVSGDDAITSSRERTKLKSSSTFTCDFIASWMVQEHRARGYQVPQTEDFVDDFKTLRIDICASASSCDHVDSSLLVNQLSHYLLHSHSLTYTSLYLQFVTGEIYGHRT